MSRLMIAAAAYSFRISMYENAGQPNFVVRTEVPRYNKKANAKKEPINTKKLIFGGEATGKGVSFGCSFAFEFCMMMSRKEGFIGAFELIVEI